ncbi:protein of unknown function [Streptomyces murinus]
MFFLSPGRAERNGNGDKNKRTSTRSLTDRASDYGSEGCRFESCRVHIGPEALWRDPQGLWLLAWTTGIVRVELSAPTHASASPARAR